MANHKKPGSEQDAWIFLRGLAREAGHWGEFPQAFEAAMPGVKVIAVDLPGAGKNYGSECPLSVPEITEYVRREVKRDNQVTGAISLLSVSLGGMIAMEWMHRYPDELKRSVLINTSVASLTPFYKRLRWQAMPRFFTARAKKDRVDTESVILSLISRRRDIHPEVAQEWAQIAHQRPVSPQAALRQLYAAFRYKGIENPPPIPTLVVVGLGDELVDPCCSEDIHQAWGWPIVRHPWAGHDLTLDDGDWVIDQVKKWVSMSPFADKSHLAGGAT